MAKHILFIHGGGEGAYAEDQKLVASLHTLLGPAYQMTYPQMPDEHSPSYDAWKVTILQLLSEAPMTLIVGHSFGASIVLKVLSETADVNNVAGLFLIATPYWRASDWEVDEYALAEEFASKLPEVPLFLYHSKDDEIVPFAHFALYAEKLPQAILREVDGRGHQFNNDLHEVAEDIEFIQTK